jgi:hypothetical protein
MRVLDAECSSPRRPFPDLLGLYAWQLEYCRPEVDKCVMGSKGRPSRRQSN